MTKIKENKKKEIKSTGLTNIFQRRNRSSRRTDPYQRTTDGRQFRRTGRTIQFTTRVTPEYDELIRDIAYQENSLLVEILEKSLESYCREINWKGGLSKTKVKHNNLTEREREREREQKSKIEPKK